MRFELEFGKSAGSAARRGQDPLRLLILADLVGASEAQPLAERRLTRVDVDNFEKLFARYAPSLTLGGKADDAESLIRFASLDDFHPDKLVQKTKLFQSLRDLRRRLLDPASFAAAAAEIRSETPIAAAAETQATDVATPDAPPTSMFERLLGQADIPERQERQQRSAQRVIDSLIQGVVAPHIVATPDPQQAQLVAAVDMAMGDTMRGLLQYPPMKRLEATWRGIHWLVTSLELGEERELYLLHVTREELAQGLGPNSGLYKKLVDEQATPDGLRFDALLGNYRFGATEGDLTLLESIAGLAAAAGAPFVADAGASLLGCRAIAEQPDPTTWAELDPAIAQRWQALRASPAARFVGLALPRVLLRLPYGEKTDEIEAFEFEELALGGAHESLPWGSAAFACGMLMAGVGPSGQIDDLPAYVARYDGESKLKPCAEVLLSERAATTILDRGIMPLLSFRDRNAVRLIRFQSIADPPAALGG